MAGAGAEAKGDAAGVRGGLLRVGGVSCRGAGARRRRRREYRERDCDCDCEWGWGCA